MQNFNFMDKVLTWTNKECLFIAYYRQNSGHPRCMLHCPTTKETFFYSLSKITHTHGKVI
jgi:hypothetical protein